MTVWTATGEAPEGFAAIRNLFDEWYPRDTSKKVRVDLAAERNR